MIKELPFTSDPAHNFTVALGDVKYFFDVRYNDRSKTWVFDLYDDDTKTPLLKAIQLVLGSDLFEPYNFGIGSLLVVDESYQSKDATFDDLGTRVKVYWFSADELL
jgi:hypothetical protein